MLTGTAGIEKNGLTPLAPPSPAELERGEDCGWYGVRTPPFSRSLREHGMGKGRWAGSRYFVALPLSLMRAGLETRPYKTHILIICP